jgi:hypothetical protein
MISGARADFQPNLGARIHTMAAGIKRPFHRQIEPIAGQKIFECGLTALP